VPQANTADDLAYVRVRVVDAEGRQVSDSEDVAVSFAIQGAGMHIAVRGIHTSSDRKAAVFNCLDAAAAFFRQLPPVVRPPLPPPLPPLPPPPPLSLLLLSGSAFGTSS
jgi:hypothetical protein